MIPVVHSTDLSYSSSIHLRPYSVSPKDNDSSLLSVSHTPQLRSHSTPATPLLVPSFSNTSFVSSQHVQSQKPQGPHGKRLLMPTVYAPRQTTQSPPLSSSKSSPSKSSRSRAGSISASPEMPDRSSVGSIPEIIVPGCKFEVAENELEIEGFQIYAVEKWVVERRRRLILLTVFTGNPEHKITVTALRTPSMLSRTEADAEWDKVLHDLRRDGARPKETDKGILMVTSLANFRSDYTIVHIPHGNFLEVREQLFTNINILRMGCGGRSALTLEEPSDTTKDRFITMYHIPDKAQARSCALFNFTVLELVKLIQAGLAIFGMFDLAAEERNGLLCDVTCEGIQRWITEVGEHCLKVEPMERVADPTVVAALFSLILSTRNKLHALGCAVPKDPLVDPNAFVKALTTFQQSKGHAHSLSLSHHSPIPPHSTPLIIAAAPSPPMQAQTPLYLTASLIDAINTAYDKKVRQGEAYKVHRVLKSKLDDLATDLRTAEGLGSGLTGLKPTTDLGAVVKTILSGTSAKEGAASLRYLWSGRPEQIGRKRKEREAVWSEGEREDGEREWKEREKQEAKANKERDKTERERERDAKSTDDDGDYLGGRPWGGRMQRKIENWTAMGRVKKSNTDSGKYKSSLSPESPPHQPSPVVPSVVISREEEDDLLSSGQVSPTSDSQHLNPLLRIRSADQSASEVSEYDRRVNEFNQKRPSTRPSLPSRISSWSDPWSARGLLDENWTNTIERLLSRGEHTVSEIGVREEERTVVDYQIEADSDTHRQQTNLCGPRRRSFDDVAILANTRVLPVDRMRIDVELSGQLLVMHRRAVHLANVRACLSTITGTLSATNAAVREDYDTHRPALQTLAAPAQVLPEIEAARAKADAMMQETRALAYESEQFLVEDLWHMASAPRTKVLEMRERVFGTGRREHRARVQWTLDGRERLVDALGRTDSEVDEEEGLPGDQMSVDESEDDLDVARSQTLRPTWVLRFFNYWGSKWGAGGKQDNSDGASGKSTALDSSLLTIPRTVARNHTF